MFVYFCLGCQHFSRCHHEIFTEPNGTLISVITNRVWLLIDLFDFIVSSILFLLNMQAHTLLMNIIDLWDCGARFRLFFFCWCCWLDLLHIHTRRGRDIEIDSPSIHFIQTMMNDFWCVCVCVCIFKDNYDFNFYYSLPAFFGRSGCCCCLLNRTFV